MIKSEKTKLKMLNCKGAQNNFFNKSFSSFPNKSYQLEKKQTKSIYVPQNNSEKINLRGSPDSGIEASPNNSSRLNTFCEDQGFGSPTNQNKNKLWTLLDDDNYGQSRNQQPPNDRQLNAVERQVSFYFSDDYLQRDKYLLRQVRCKKDGFISLKLITSFKNIKKLTTDCNVVRRAIICKSTDVIVSGDGLRVSRRTCLPEHLKKPRLLKSVLVIRLPQAFNSESSIDSLFGVFGEISEIRLLEAGKDVPSDLRNYATQVRDIGKFYLNFHTIRRIIYLQAILYVITKKTNQR